MPIVLHITMGIRMACQAVLRILRYILLRGVRGVVPPPFRFVLWISSFNLIHPIFIPRVAGRTPRTPRTPRNHPPDTNFFVPIAVPFHVQVFIPETGIDPLLKRSAESYFEAFRVISEGHLQGGRQKFATRTPRNERRTPRILIGFLRRLFSGYPGHDVSDFDPCLAEGVVPGFQEAFPLGTVLIGLVIE